MHSRLLLYLLIISSLIFSGCFIKGRITDENGRGVAGVTVNLSGAASGVSTTNRFGYYQFGSFRDKLPAGSYTVTPSGDTTPASREVTLTMRPTGNAADPVTKVNFVYSSENVSPLDGLLRYIDENNTGVDGLIIIHRGEILVEEYYEAFDSDTIHDLQSTTKSFTSALIGIAIDLGFIQSIDQLIIELLPEYSDLFTGDKNLITLRHLLEMSSGLEWRDFRTQEEPMSSFDEIAQSDDSVAYILTQALVTSPGEVFFYNTGSSHLLSAIIHYRTGMTTLEFAEEFLFGPLGITEYTWNTTPDGIQQGGWGLSLRPMDMALFGELFLNKGALEDVQLISQSWAEESTAFQIEVEGDDDDYAFHWWRPGGFDTEIYAALGWAGQCIYVLNELNLVVILTGRDPDAGYVEPDYMMKAYILPEVEDLESSQ